MAKTFIKNRKGQKVAVLVEETPNQKGLAFVMHGLGGFKEQPHIQVIADAFRDHGCTVVRFDTTNSIGESDGRYEDATTTNYYEDLEDVIKWAEAQKWYQKPFALAGHSLGGFSTAFYAENFPNKVKLLAPISTMVSGVLSMGGHESDEKWKQWKQTGWKIEESESRPGLIKRLPWSHMEDRLKYDLLLGVAKLTMPVLIIVGDLDAAKPANQILYNALPGSKELHIIKDAPHTFRKPYDLAQLRKLFDQWVEKYD